MNYKAEIDGLRALSILGVILFHINQDIFSGGFIGVDIFFLISGYLITKVIIADFSKKRFSLLNFYQKRIRRILPALLFK
jgi:peptidoglycan/LPS O-acetylase OafA/YrhL